ncbi:unnamed protein product [Dovyalis caffra]|uniref:Uncharacterized protein n=1 Tax=Dovyalis caffra TaxID=77055 RepID=A0AAV1S0H4_9ROSI|nr:unnamed protein product [Dovyalis caffra]
MTPGQASLAKGWISLKARETSSIGRELLGGNGILADFLVAKETDTFRSDENGIFHLTEAIPELPGTLLLLYKLFTLLYSGSHRRHYVI